MDLYTLNKLINLPGYTVKKILKFTDLELHILMAPLKRFKATCSYCKEIHKEGLHSTTTVVAEDETISGRRVFLHIIKRKYKCPKDNRIHIEQTPWLKLFSRFTNRYCHKVTRLTAITTNKEAAWFLGLNDKVVYRIDKSNLENLANKHLNPIPKAINLSIDEVSYKKYHHYLTNVIDIDKKLVIWNSEGRKKETLNNYYKGIGKDNCKKIESVAMDGAKTYISSTTKYAVNALIVYDKFHLIQKLNQTVDQVRKEELREAKKYEDIETIEMINSKRRFILLKNKKKLTKNQSFYLNTLCERNKNIFKAMILKESFLGLYSLKDKSEYSIISYISSWIKQAKNSDLEAFKILAEKLLPKIRYILNWFKRKVSSAISEGFNNKIKRLKRMAYGYRDIDYFRLKIHQHCGLLNPRKFGLNST